MTKTFRTSSLLGPAVASALVLALVLVAQAQTPPPSDGPGNPRVLVQRLMSGDKDGDGKLSKDEMPEDVAVRLFARADTNHDGFVDREELIVAVQAQPPAGGGEGRGAPGAPGRGEGRGDRGGQPPSFEGAMKQSDRALKALRKSPLDASSRSGDLDLVQALESGLVATKSQITTVPMSDKAKAKFGNDQNAYQTAFRRELLKALSGAIALETAILDGKAEEAKKIVAQLTDEKEAGHATFQQEEAPR